MPGPPSDEGTMLGSLDFHELLDEDALKRKFAVVNRAPVMMAWACVVAERLGFSREEALSIGMGLSSPTLPFLIHEHGHAMPSVGVHRNERD